MAEELIINVNVSGKENLGDLQKDLNKVQESGKKTTNAFSQMRREMRDAKADMLSYAEGTKEYNAAMQKAADAADRMRDMQDKIKASQKDIGVVAKNVSGAISGLAGAFSTVEGAIGLFGVQSEDTTKAILKMQQIMSVTSGIAQMADSFDSIKDLFNAVKLRVVALIAAKQAETVASVENTAANTAEAGAITATGVAANITGKAILKSLGPYALAAAAIALIATGVIKLIQKITEVPAEIKLNVKMDEEVAEKLVTNIQKAHQFAIDYNAAVKSGNKDRIKDLTEVGAKEFNLNKDRLKMIGDNVNNWRSAFDDYINIAKRAYREEMLIKASAQADSDELIARERHIQLLADNKKLIADLRKGGVSEEDIMNAASGKWYKKGISIQSLINGKNNEENIKNIKLLSAGAKAYNDNMKAWNTAKASAEDAQKRLTEFELKNPPIVPKTTDIVTKPEKTKKEPTLIKSVENEEFIPEVAPVIEGLKKLEGVSKEFEEVNKNITDSNAKAVEDNNLLIAKKGKTILQELNIEKDYFQKIKNNAEKNIINAKRIKSEQEALYQSETDLLNKKIDDYNKAYQEDINKQTDYKNKIEKNNLEMKKIDEEFKNAKTDATRKKLQARQTELENENANNKKELDLTENHLKGLEKTKDEIDTGTKSLEDISAKVKDASSVIIDANNAITDSNMNLAENSKQTWSAMMQNVQSYGETAASVFDAIANLNQAEIDSNNSKYDQIEENINNSNKSEDEKTAALKKNEEERYKENLKVFEAQKKWQIASTIASGAVSIAKTWEGYASMGVAGTILAGIQTAVIAANTIAQIKTIKAQRMDAPSESSSSSSTASSATANVYQALAPSTTSMTSSQENLNMMNATNQQNLQSVVLVSDVNKVQNKVTVRDNNRNY